MEREKMLLRLALLFLFLQTVQAQDQSLERIFDGQQSKISSKKILERIEKIAPLPEKKPDIDFVITEENNSGSPEWLYSSSTGETAQLQLKISRNQWESVSENFLIPRLYADLEIAKIRKRLDIPNGIWVDLLEEIRIFHEIAFLRRMLAANEFQPGWSITPEEYSYIQSRYRLDNPLHLKRNFEIEAAARLYSESGNGTPALMLKGCNSTDPQMLRNSHLENWKKQRFSHAAAYLENAGSLDPLCEELLKEKALAKKSMQVEIPEALERSFTHRIGLLRRIEDAAARIHLESQIHDKFKLQNLHQDIGEIAAYAKAKGIALDEGQIKIMVKDSIVRTHFRSEMENKLSDPNLGVWRLFARRSLAMASQFQITPVQRALALKDIKARIPRLAQDFVNDFDRWFNAEERLEILQELAVSWGASREEIALITAEAGLKIGEKIAAANGNIEFARRTMNKIAELSPNTRENALQMLDFHLKLAALQIHNDKEIELTELMNTPGQFAQKFNLQNEYKEKAGKFYAGTLRDFLTKNSDAFRKNANDSNEKAALRRLKSAVEIAQTLNLKEALGPSIVKGYMELALINAEAGWLTDAEMRFAEAQTAAQTLSQDFEAENFKKAMLEKSLAGPRKLVQAFSKNVRENEEKKALEALQNIIRWADRLNLKGEFANHFAETYLELAQINAKAGYPDDALPRLEQAAALVKPYKRKESLEIVAKAYADLAGQFAASSHKNAAQNRKICEKAAKELLK